MTELIDNKYDRGYTSATCYVCRDLWDQVDTLRAELAVAEGERDEARRALIDLLEDWRFEYDTMKYKGQYAYVLRRCANELARALATPAPAPQQGGR